LNAGGDYTQTGGTLAIDLAGANFGRLQIAGSATLGGALAITLVNSYFPNLGDTFQILTFGSRTGSPPSDFGAKYGLDIGSGLRFDAVYGANSLTLVTVVSPAPPSPPRGEFPNKGTVGAVGTPPVIRPITGAVGFPEIPAPGVAGGIALHRNRVDAVFQAFDAEMSLLADGE